MDCRLSGSSIHKIFQARAIEYVVIHFSIGSSQPRDRTRVSHIVGRHFIIWATREVPMNQKVKEKIYVLLVWFQDIKQMEIGPDTPNQVHTYTHAQKHKTNNSILDS